MSNITDKENSKLVLAIDPAPRGFGYALFEGPKRPVDWGVTEARVQTNKRSLHRIKQLIEFYQPDVIVLEDYKGKQSHRGIRVQSLIDKIVLLAKLKKIKIHQYSRGRIREVFLKFRAKNKHQIANIICEWLPELSPRLPPKRKIWMSEDQRMNIFDAVSLALTYYYLEK